MVHNVHCINYRIKIYTHTHILTHTYTIHTYTPIHTYAQCVCMCMCMVYVCVSILTHIYVRRTIYIPYKVCSDRLNTYIIVAVFTLQVLVYSIGFCNADMCS